MKKLISPEFFFLLGSMILIGQLRLVGAPFDQAGHIHTIPTFECISIYFPSAQKGDCQVFYKSSTAETWKQALDLVYGYREQEYRGSIVRLDPNTTYSIKLLMQGEEFYAETATLSDQWKIGKTTPVSSGPRHRLVRNNIASLVAYRRCWSTDEIRLVGC